MTLSVRRAGPGDLDLAHELLAEFFAAENLASVGSFRANLATFLELAENAVFVAEDGGRPVGVATVTTDYGLEYGRCAELEDLYVLPERRGGGAGAELVEAACGWARELGCGAIHLMVTPEGQLDAGLKGFYRNRGFTDTGRRVLLRRLAEGGSGDGGREGP